MHAKTAVRRIARSILGPRLTAVTRRPFRPQLASLEDYRTRMQSKASLEIGGPSALFGEAGALPIYDVLGSLDNCLYSATTLWAGQVEQGNTFRYDPRRQPGRQIIAEATDLSLISDSSYECVLASHCLEHTANPLRALAEWKRILKDEGLLLLILPHRDGTFDWRRPTTTLEHMVADYEQGTGENDLTHLPEILELHDLSRDEEAGTKEQFRERCLANHRTRAMHHHVFDTMAALRVVDHAGFQIIRVDHLTPFHIIVLATRVGRGVDNRRFMDPGADHWSRSPFPSDRLDRRN